MTCDYPETLAAHDDRCDDPLGGPCNCDEWEQFDEERSWWAAEDECGCDDLWHDHCCEAS